MGDNGKLFLPAELVPIYQNIIVPLAATLTPNAFEAEQLTGLKIDSENDALAACRALHERGPTTVVSALCTPCLLWLLPAWHSFWAEIRDQTDALAACRALHERAPTTMARLCTQSPCNTFELRKGVLQCGAMAE